MTCKTCRQEDKGQTGEYPCNECGLPTIWDNSFEQTKNKKDDLDDCTHVAEPNTFKPSPTELTDEEKELIFRLPMETLNDVNKLVSWDRELKRRHNKEIDKLRKELAKLKQEVDELVCNNVSAHDNIASLKQELAESIPKAKVQEEIDKIKLYYILDELLSAGEKEQ